MAATDLNDSSLLRIEPFQGVDLSTSPTLLTNSQATEMLNLHIDERGALNKRFGYERLPYTFDAVGPVHGMYEYIRINGERWLMVAQGVKIYAFGPDNKRVVANYNYSAEQKVIFFTVTDKCYILGGNGILVFSGGTTISNIVPYVPTVSISRTPLGTGSTNEDFNILSRQFKDSFSADGTSKDFFLSVKNLATTAPIVNVNNVVLAATEYTFDAVNGKITFNTAPTQGTNNVIIQATMSGAVPNSIAKCTIGVMYGGSNDTRIFLSGNAAMPDYVWRSGLYDPTYFPDMGYYKFPEKVTGFAKQYDSLIVERENGKHQITFTIGEDGTISFPSKPINDEIGTVASQSIQILENNPTSLSKKGVYALTSSTVRDERNVVHLSKAIDDMLLKEPNLEKAVSIDSNKKYWLAINDKVFVMDYRLKSEINPSGEWFIYDNIPAKCFVEFNGRLLFGDKTTGIIYRFKTEADQYPYNDDGQPINSKWKSKLFNFGADELKKLVERVYISMKPSSRTSVGVNYLSDRSRNATKHTSRGGYVDYSFFNYGAFTYATNDYPRTFVHVVKMKKIGYFQIIIENDQLDEPLGVLSLSIKYRLQSYVK